MIVQKNNYIKKNGRISKDGGFSSAMCMFTGDNMISLGSDPIMLPKDDPNFVYLQLLPNNIDTSKSKSTSENYVSDNNFRNIKALPNINLKNSLSPALEKNNSADDSIQSTAVQSDM